MYPLPRNLYPSPEALSPLPILLAYTTLAIFSGLRSYNIAVSALKYLGNVPSNPLPE